jgi:hypothetical protein
LGVIGWGGVVGGAAWKGAGRRWDLWVKWLYVYCIGSWGWVVGSGSKKLLGVNLSLGHLGVAWYMR